MGLVDSYKMEEEERLKIQRLKTDIEALEIYVAGGSASVEESNVRKLALLNREIEEFKRDMLLEHGLVDDETFNYNYYFDTVAGRIWMSEDDE